MKDPFVFLPFFIVNYTFRTSKKVLFSWNNKVSICLQNYFFSLQNHISKGK